MLNLPFLELLLAKLGGGGMLVGKLGGLLIDFVCPVKKQAFTQNTKIRNWKNFNLYMMV
jgi:hypothetical protein